MKVALVHDYLNEYGGAERVLEVLCEIFPKAPIYTAFYKKGSPAYKRFVDTKSFSSNKRFKGRKIITSWTQNVPFFASRLHSPLRFLAPLIWNSFDFSKYDLVITSSSWYVTKGLVKRKTTNDKRKTVEVCYCHTPPRYLYGYPTAKKQKGFLIKTYALLVNHFMRVYDFEAAQRVDYFIANSKEVAARIKKFYRRDSTVIYPPVDLPKVPEAGKQDYFLIVSRIVGAKGLQLAIDTANKLGFKLKVVGKEAGYAGEYQKIKSVAGRNVEFLGYVSDSELAKLYSRARASLALATDEDFGITPVEAMLCGTPVIAYKGGGYLESVVDGKTGVFFSPDTAGSLTLAINKFLQLEKKGAFDPKFIRKYAQKFSKERFKKEILKFAQSKVK